MESVGRGLIRPDVYNKVLGKSIYPDDLEFEGMLYAGVKRSTIPYGKVKNINMEELKKYRIEVGRSTRDIVENLSTQDMKRNFDKHRLQRILDERAVLDVKA